MTKKDLSPADARALLMEILRAELARILDRQAEAAIFEYINGFYSPRRRHSALGWKSPVAFEGKLA
ncbi:hypothetical protein [Jhaorihella thermophila]|uniref:Transposase n=2 Tax=Jhaorihella thermophila TaxID=488547 RepID=A0A1H5XT09_9RHOB|nr:hypothetical protein SAMN05421751_11281 [Jhaorihella thermophila]